jgi:dimethylargininase
VQLRADGMLGRMNDAHAAVAGSAVRPKVALVRRPAANLDEGQLTHIDRVPVDPALAEKQWNAYREALESEGWRTIEVEPAPDLPDSVFIEDAVVMFGDTAVLASPGALTRRAESAGAEAAVRELGIRIIPLELPATLDGGDVLKIGKTVYVGLGTRTNAEGVRQLAAAVEPLGYTVVPVPVTRALHLKSAVTALPDGTVIGHESLVDDASVFPRFTAVPEVEGTAVVILDDETLLMSSAAPRSAALFESLGYRVVATEISEFEKLEGCVTCLSVRIR